MPYKDPTKRAQVNRVSVDNYRKTEHGRAVRSAANARYKKTDKGRATDRRASYKARYGITVEDYDRMLAEQGGVCALCGRPPIEGKRLHVDHDHTTNRVRGLLCVNCNTALGRLEANIEKVYQYIHP